MFVEGVGGWKERDSVVSMTETKERKRLKGRKKEIKTIKIIY